MLLLPGTTATPTAPLATWEQSFGEEEERHLNRPKLVTPGPSAVTLFATQTHTLGNRQERLHRIRELNAFPYWAPWHESWFKY